MQADTVSCSIG